MEAARGSPSFQVKRRQGDVWWLVQRRTLDLPLDCPESVTQGAVVAGKPPVNLSRGLFSVTCVVADGVGVVFHSGAEGYLFRQWSSKCELWLWDLCRVPVKSGLFSS